MLKETSKLDVKSASTLIEPNKKLYLEESEKLKDIGQYQRLIEKLIYLTVTRLVITFIASLISQFMPTSRTTHLEAVNRILRYLKGFSSQGIWMKKNNINTIVGYSDANRAGIYDRKSITGYCTFVGGNLLTRKSKKQNMIVWLIAEVEY
jgi:hypothetical protein